MTLALVALVLCSQSPPSLVSAVALGQGKVQIIKGKKGTVKAANAAQEGAPVQAAPDAQGQQNTARAQELDRRAADLDAKNKDVSAREQALQEKEATTAEADKKKAEQLKAQQKHIEKIGEQNQKMLQQATDSLAGD